jgi:hypothetical protein
MPLLQPPELLQERPWPLGQMLTVRLLLELLRVQLSLLGQMLTLLLVRELPLGVLRRKLHLFLGQLVTVFL